MSELHRIFNQTDLLSNKINKINKIKNIYKGKYTLYLTCGKNINEHVEKIKKISTNDNVLTICYKRSIEYVNNKCDILIIDPRTKLDLEKVDVKFTIMFNDIINKDEKELKKKFKYDLLINNIDGEYIGISDMKAYSFFEKINENNIVFNKKLDIYFKVFPLLHHLGINNIFLFGAYFCNEQDLNVESFICKPNKFGFRGDLIVPKEPSVFLRNIQSSLLAEWAITNSINIYNVTTQGTMSTKIKRILFDDIFKENKNFLISKHVDIIDQINFDYNYYSKKYDLYNTKSKYYYKLLAHYLNLGSYMFFFPNKNREISSNKSSINFNDIDIDLCKIAYFSCELPQNELKSNNSEQLISSYMVHVYHILLYYGFDIKNCNDIKKIPFNHNFDNVYFKSFIKHSKYWNNLTNENKLFITNNISNFVSIKAVLNFNYNLINYKLLNNFNLNIYKKFNKDLVKKKLKDYELIKHYISFGYREKRICNLINLPNDFNWHEYVDLYPDLKKVIKTETKAITHYLNNGILEGRKYKRTAINYKKNNSDYNWKDYIYLNIDLSYIKTKKDALYHYEKFGKKEKRLASLSNLPKDFNWKKYIELNEDLKFIISEVQAISHFLKHGILEKRKYK